MTRRRFLLILGAVLAGLAVGAGVIVATAPAAPLTFADDRNASSFTLQLDPSAPDAGHLVFRIPARGFYVAELPASAIHVVSANSTVVDFKGTATLRPAVDSRGTITGTVTTTRQVNITVLAYINPVRRAAAATLLEGTQPYVVVASRLASDPTPVLSAAEDATVRADARALYPLMSGDVTSVYTPETFAQLIDEQRASSNRVTGMHRVSVSAPQTTARGLTYAIASYNVDYVSPAGVSGTSPFEMFLVLDSGTWRVAFTRPR